MHEFSTIEVIVCLWIFQTHKTDGLISSTLSVCYGVLQYCTVPSC